MFKKEIYLQIKNMLKDLGLEIRKLKNDIKNGMREKQLVYKIQWTLADKKYQYRHHHIARSELRGRTRDQIEKPSKDHKADESYIEQIKNEWIKMIEESVAA